MVFQDVKSVGDDTVCYSSTRRLPASPSGKVKVSFDNILVVDVGSGNTTSYLDLSF